MGQIGVFVDVSNLYYSLKYKYKNRKLNYKKLLEFIQGYGDISKAIAYGSQMNDQAFAFIRALTHAGFETKFKEPKEYIKDDTMTRKANWDVAIAMDMVKMSDEVTMMILASADGDMTPVVEYVQNKGIPVVVIACQISGDLTATAKQCVEIPESLLEEKKKRENIKES